MTRRTWPALLAALVLTTALPAAGAQAHLEQRSAQLHEITVSLGELELTKAGGWPISVELPLAVGDSDVKAFYTPPAGGVEKRLLDQKALDRYPPSPDNQGRWVTYMLPAGAVRMRLEITSGTPLTFARVILGDPFSPDAILVGAISSSANSLTTTKNGTIIRAGEDLLGTKEAMQRMKLPAGFLGVGTAPFDDMVAFTEAPFLETNNIDTVMIRTMDIPPGGTTPVRLLKFRNRTAEPITINGPTGPIQFEITATLSPNATSGGFITINADGTYQSTTALHPLFSFQRLDLNGDPDGKPIIVDTVLQNIPGFPFYLASQGGKWTSEPPAGRLVTAASSNFFYDNGDVNYFAHSNGPIGKNGKQELFDCAKLSGAE